MFEIQLLSEAEGTRLISCRKIFSVYLKIVLICVSWDDQFFEPQTVSQLKTSFLLLEKKPCLCLQSAPARPTDATPALHTGKVRERKCRTGLIFSISEGPGFPGGAEFLTSETFGTISVYLQAHITMVST